MYGEVKDPALNQSHNSAFRVGVFKAKLAGWISVLFFGGLSFWAYHDGEYGPILVFAVFILIGFILLLFSGNFSLSKDRLVHHTLFGTFAIRWEEVSRVEFGADGVTHVFYGRSKRFVIPDESLWSGSNKKIAAVIFYKGIEDLESKGIIPTYNKWAGYKIHKNTRIKNN